jgi:hypothetical protein
LPTRAGFKGVDVSALVPGQRRNCGGTFSELL